jgi:hypothetical protein
MLRQGRDAQVIEHHSEAPLDALVVTSPEGNLGNRQLEIVREAGLRDFHS